MNREKLQILTFDHSSSEIDCTNYSAMNLKFAERYHFRNDVDQNQAIEHEDNDMNEGVSLRNPQKIDANKEEYLDEEDDEMLMEMQHEPGICIEDSKPFTCAHCCKTFLSRSGRDTHQQMKHKVPKEFTSVDIQPHMEVELENGRIMKAWKCPICKKISHRKNHHLIHLSRHAIREKEMTIKQEDKETCFVITNQTLNEDVTNDDKFNEQIVALEASPEIIRRREASNVADAESIPKKSKASESFVTSKRTSGGIQFSCSLCNSKFHDEEGAKYHCAKYGSTGMCTNNICLECDVVFNSEKMYKRHQGYHALIPIANVLEYFECVSCFVIFSSKKDLDTHMSNHTEVKNYQYVPETATRLEVGEVLIRDLECQWNRRDLSDGTAYHCGYCLKSGLRNDINLHMTLFHANLICPFDKQKFSRSLGFFVDHMKVQNLFSCFRAKILFYFL